MLKKFFLCSDGIRLVRKNLFWLVYGLIQRTGCWLKSGVIKW